MKEVEINFDGIVGPTHNFAGLSHGNLASMQSRNDVSNPRQAAIEGLEKMRRLALLGVPQAVLPPHERPHLSTLRALGFSGSDERILEQAGSEHPTLLACVSSASAMWAANAATVSPSADTSDGLIHLTPANLVTQFHRSIEPQTTERILRAIFCDTSRFAVHRPLPSIPHLSDEGAANHTRLVDEGCSCELFTWGRAGLDIEAAPTRFPVRQTLEACQGIARRHGVRNVVFVRQNPVAIDHGAFHNDVVAVGHRNLLLIHERAWERQAQAIREIRTHLPSLYVIEVPEKQLSLRDAISSYLFNSQLVTVPSGDIHLIAPIECQTNDAARRLCEAFPRDRVAQVHFVDVRQSMKNGGGPACLRLRVAVTDVERSAINAGVMFEETLYQSLKAWIERHYRDTLTPSDLRDPKLMHESRIALDELTRLLRLGSVYPFQT